MPTVTADPITQRTRFGLGPRPADTGGGDLTALLAADLDSPPPPDKGPPPASGSDGLAALKAMRDMRRAGVPPGLGTPNPVRDILERDRLVTFNRGVAVPIGFRERLVTFWANHFTVSVRQNQCRALAGAFRREAIEPYVTARFADMLLAVMRHPAMLHYLDNAGSVGPNSRAGLRRDRGLNENLARESLELHTLSPAGGYSQADVTAFAAILTGWSVQSHDLPYGFLFRPAAHEPGTKTLLGRTFPEGEGGGLEALAFLAGHPATNAHLARQLVTHFGADEADPKEVGVIAATLSDTGGDLRAASLALLHLRSTHRPLTKLRTPNDFVLAAFRALDLPPSTTHPPGPAFLATLGQPIFQAPLPNGWPDRAADWAGPASIPRRTEIAATLATRAALDTDPMLVARTCLGPLLHPDLENAIAHAGSRTEALTYLLASAAFQRR